MSNSEKKDFQGKTAIVTGASKGIGLSIAEQLAMRGANVVISSRKQEACDEVAKSLTSKGFTALGVACHMGAFDQIQTLVDKSKKEFGGIDIIVNNAATNPIYGGIEDATGDAFDKIMGVNVKGPLQLSQLAFEDLKTSNGNIVNISSIEGLSPGLGLGAYSVSKSALITLTKVLAKEWGKHGIRSNVVCPGLVETKFSEALTSNEKVLKHVMTKQAVDYLANPDDIAGLVVFLASDDAKFITGGVYTADGGYTI